MKKYLKVEPNESGITHLKVEVYYNLGGCNRWNGHFEKRGYYISVIPVERTKNSGFITESMTAFSGTKYCLKEVTRKSQKAEKESEDIAQTVEKELVYYVLSNNNLILSEGEI